jgi:site-specific DNA-methyltransferase (adenine-specific)
VAKATGLNRLFYGDNLDVMRASIATESVDLVYLDPPFNSNRNYNVLFKHKTGNEAQAQIEAFNDTWTWSQDAERTYQDLITGGAPAKVADAIEAMRRLVGDNDVLAYLVMMTPRLVELHRVLKPTGSLYLHCDPTASHYLKVILDAIFGPENFRNEIVWKRTIAKGSPMGRLPANHDVILAYVRSASATWHQPIEGYDPDNLDEKTLSKYALQDPDGRRYQLTSLLHPEQGRRPNLEYELMGVTRTWRWSKDRMEKAVQDGLVVQPSPGAVPRQKRYLDEQKGRMLDDIWTDIPPINSQAAERLGYPTQKPLALLERIIASSSNEGDVVLDPFCGCGTAVDAAQKLGRRWIGIDVTYLAVDLIDKRLRHTYGESIRETYEVVGIPRDVGGARALFQNNPFDFERWAVSLVNGQPNEKQVADKGSDGTIRFSTGRETERVVVSVKGGKHLMPAFVNELIGAVGTSRSAMGVLITLEKPTRGMVEAANKSGLWTNPANQQTFPKVQILTIEELLAGKKPDLPPLLMPYTQAQRRDEDVDQMALGF